ALDLDPLAELEIEVGVDAHVHAGDRRVDAAIPDAHRRRLDERLILIEAVDAPHHADLGEPGEPGEGLELGRAVSALEEEAERLLSLVDEIASPGPVGVLDRALHEAGEILVDAEALVEEGDGDARVGAALEADVVEERDLAAHRLGALRLRRRVGIDVVEADAPRVDVVEADDARELGAAGVEAREDAARTRAARDLPLAEHAAALARAVLPEARGPLEVGGGEGPGGL